jgi:PAS domain-containing protein
MKGAIHPLQMGGVPQKSTPDAQLFRDVFNASPIGIVVENLEGQPLFVNPAFCAFLGFSNEDLHSKHCVDFSPAEDAAKDWALFQQLRAGSAISLFSPMELTRPCLRSLRNPEIRGKGPTRKCT